MAARMVDAQAPGLARRLRAAASIAHSGQPNWVEILLTELSKIHLLVRGYSRLTELPPGLQAEVRSQIGWSIAQEELVAMANSGAAATIADNWLILGQTITEEEGNLRAQRIWLRGNQCFAMILNFVHRQAPLDITWQSGTTVATQMIFYPSSAPLRALVQPLCPRIMIDQGATITADSTLALALASYYQALQYNPWLENFPLLVNSVIPYRQDDAWWLIDLENSVLPLQITDRQGWILMALSGGQSLTLAGLWNGQQLQPIGIWVNEQYQSLEN
jgi:hypothetical protein